MAEKKEVAQKQEFTTNLSEWTNLVTGLVSRDFELCGVQYDEYSKQCAMNAMSAIFQLVQNTDKADICRCGAVACYCKESSGINRAIHRSKLKQIAYADEVRIRR